MGAGASNVGSKLEEVLGETKRVLKENEGEKAKAMALLATLETEIQSQQKMSDRAIKVDPARQRLSETRDRLRFLEKERLMLSAAYKNAREKML